MLNAQSFFFHSACAAVIPSFISKVGKETVGLSELYAIIQIRKLYLYIGMGQNAATVNSSVTSKTVSNNQQK